MKQLQKERFVLGPGDVETFRQALELEEKAPATVQKYTRDVKAFQRYLESNSADSFSRETVIAYKNWLSRNYAPRSVNSMLAALNKFFKVQGYESCVVKPLKIQKEMFRSKNQELTKEEYFALLDAAELCRDRRTAMVMKTLCSTGIRVGELQYITVEAAKAGMADIALKGKCRVILLPDKLQQELLAYAEEQGVRRGPIFLTGNGNVLDRSTILRRMKALGEPAGVPVGKIYPHNLRHLFACCFYEQTKDISRLADILGHSSIDTTRIYTSVSLEEQRNVIDRLDLLAREM